jgi:hypothetical protein
VLGRECWSLLIAERTLPAIVAGIGSIANADPHIASVAAVKTMHVGPEDRIVAVELRFEPRCERYSEIDELLIDADSFAQM